MDRRRIGILACAALAALSLTACGGGGDPAAEAAGAEGEGHEPHREGLALPLDGVNYNVFLTRQLNLADPEDSDYVDIDPAPPGSTYYGVFMEACNITEESVTTAETLFAEDALGERFELVDIEESVFAYKSAELEPGECVPAQGSLADYGPAGGALLVFEISIRAAENRPLVLTIEGEDGHELLFELDL